MIYSYCNGLLKDFENALMVATMLDQDVIVCMLLVCIGKPSVSHDVSNKIAESLLLIYVRTSKFWIWNATRALLKSYTIK